MKRRTKIVCTLGPASDDVERLIAVGMNVARINASHGDWPTRKRWIERIRATTSADSVGVLVDLQGPKFRIGGVPDGETTVSPGDEMTFGPDNTPAAVLAALGRGARVVLGDGDVEFRVSRAVGRNFVAKACTGGVVRSRQGIRVMGRAFEGPALGPKDVDDAVEACRVGADFIALSYVRRAEDLDELRQLVAKHGSNARLCAKIETREALRDLDRIVRASDAVMVARGDLGIELPLEDVPQAQKRIIRRCNDAAVPVITATQMLESMVHAHRPTRAEATDVANAILDGTDAVMLSAETAIGAYPAEAVRTMARIAERIESSIDHDALLDRRRLIGSRLEQTEAVAQAAVRLAAALKVKAIVTTSTTGLSARMVSKFRPRTPVLCASWTDETHAFASLVWGVRSARLDAPSTTDEAVARALACFRDLKLVAIGDQVVVTAGVPPGRAGQTNLVIVETIR